MEKTILQVSKLILGSVVCFLVGCASVPEQPKPKPLSLLNSGKTPQTEKTFSASENKEELTSIEVSEKNDDNPAQTNDRVESLNTPPVQEILRLLEEREQLLKEGATQLNSKLLQSLDETLVRLEIKEQGLKRGVDKLQGQFQPQQKIEELSWQVHSLGAEHDKAQREIERLKGQLNQEKKKQDVCAVKNRRRAVSPPIRQPPRRQSAPKMVCRGSNRLVVVSLSTFSGGQRRAIRDSFSEVFSSLKKNKSGKRFTLRTIQSGRRVSGTLLTCNNLRNLSNSSIQAKVNQIMQFGATDLQSVADLTKLDSQARSKRRVLYITDNKRINASTRKREVLSAWTKAGIRLIVLTTGECSVWDNVGATCRRWSGKNGLKNNLKSFLQ